MMSDIKIPTEIEVAELINDAVGPLKSIARGLAFERDQLRAEVEGITEGFNQQAVLLDQLRTALDNMTEVARLAQEAAATAETRAVTRCAEIAESHETVTLSQVARRIKEAIRKEYGLE